VYTKSSLMLGLGENDDEIIDTMLDMKDAGLARDLSLYDIYWIWWGSFVCTAIFIYWGSEGSLNCMIG
jgi:hypothetical protein